MKKKFISFMILGMALSLLQACTTVTSNADVSTEKKEVDVTEKILMQEVTIHVENELEDNLDSYMFNGFIGEDTLSFEEKYGQGSRTSYHPAKIGYTFRFKELEQIKKAEIIDFSRDEGYVKLRLEVSSD